MSSLEDLVPPLELCKQIPEGAFADSALVWWGACVYPRLYPDGVRFNTLWHKKGTIPAPTLSEILEELATDENHVDVWNVDADAGWGVQVLEYFPVIGNHYQHDRNPAIVALKLYLELTDHKMSLPDIPDIPIIKEPEV